jgi:hypothetical protein
MENSNVSLGLIDEALGLADLISKSTERLEVLKKEIRSAVSGSGVLEGTKGHIVVTVPPQTWVLRKGVGYRDLVRVLGEDHEKYFTKVVSFELSNPQGLDSCKDARLFSLLDQAKGTTRIGFRFEGSK